VDPHDGYDGSLVLDVLGQPSKVVDRQHWRYRWHGEHRNHSLGSDRDKHPLRDAFGGLRQGAEVVSRERSGSCGVLVLHRPAAHLLCSRAVCCAYRLLRDSEAAAESGTEHRAALPLGYGVVRKPVCTLSRVGQERSVFVDLSWPRGALNDSRDLPDRKDQVQNAPSK